MKHITVMWGLDPQWQWKGGGYPRFTSEIRYGGNRDRRWQACHLPVVGVEPHETYLVRTQYMMPDTALYEGTNEKKAKKIKEEHDNSQLKKHNQKRSEGKFSVYRPCFMGEGPLTLPQNKFIIVETSRGVFGVRNGKDRTNRGLLLLSDTDPHYFMGRTPKIMWNETDARILASNAINGSIAVAALMVAGQRVVYEKASLKWDGKEIIFK